MAQCSQNNFVVDGFQLRDADGNPFSATDDYELGEEINGELWVMLGGSSTNGYNLRFYFDIYINGVLVADDQYECLFSGTQAQQYVWVKVRDFTWNWGDVVDIKDIFIYWDTGTAKEESTCVISDKNNINSQCYTNEEGFTAAVPLFPKFDFQSNGICNTTIEFTSETIGGSPPFEYTFEWDFDGLGTATGSDPVFNFPASGTYTIGLTADDGVSTTTIYKDIFIDPNFGIQVTIFPTKIDDSSGIIYVEEVTGGTEPYSFYWVGPDGFTSTNKDIFGLKDGWYYLTVTDANGCTQTVEYLLDIASVLSLDLSFLEAYWDKSADQISVSWETNKEAEAGEFEIQRKTQKQEKFQLIGTIDVPEIKIEKTSYHFQDSAFAFNQDQLYYRIRKKTKDADYYSSVLLVRREVPKALVNDWTLFPNPSVPGENLELAFLGNGDILGQKIELRLVGASGELGRKSIPMPANSKITFNSYFGPIPPGFYVLEVVWDNKVNRIKILRN
ncbi:PKD domain-containing protein [Algoriphagus hitonicola]|uniref:PKD domain-containing protein n=1 Tax=Algoriphagus hitonicola TaxID=435880 RepID=UPI0015A68137|nr:PKD domain-containing protein [Algoriphagus hitonicola]